MGHQGDGRTVLAERVNRRYGCIRSCDSQNCIITVSASVGIGDGICYYMVARIGHGRIKYASGYTRSRPDAARITGLQDYRGIG